MKRGARRWARRLTGILLCMLLILGCKIAAYACSFQSGIMTAIDYNCHVLTGGVTGRYFYKDSSTSIYNTIIGAAVSSWNTKSSDCSFTLASSYGSAAIRYTTGTVGDPSSAGQTIHYYSTSGKAGRELLRIMPVYPLTAGINQFCFYSA